MSKDESQIVNLAQPEAAPDESFIVKFNKPYRFEGDTFQSVDLSGLENLSAEDMVAADKYLTRSGNFTVMPEMTLEYALFIASRTAGKPIEFFLKLPPKEALKVKNRVTSFFYGED